MRSCENLPAFILVISLGDDSLRLVPMPIRKCSLVLRRGNMSSAATIAIPAESIPSPIHSLGRDWETRTTSDRAPAVFLIDDDIYIQPSLELLIRSHGWQPQICDSAREFLAQPRPVAPGCLILAFSSRDSNSLDVQKRIARECAEMPIIVIADYEDIPTAVQSMKAGAIDFFVKPFSDELLTAAIRQSLARSRAVLDRSKEMHDLRQCYASLSPRERQVMTLVVSGLLNKEVGGELGISEVTVKAHRGQVMQKMKAGSFAHLVNMASRLRVTRSVTPSGVSA
jgi:FixJ family two-component response regulator